MKKEIKKLMLEAYEKAKSSKCNIKETILAMQIHANVEYEAALKFYLAREQEKKNGKKTLCASPNNKA